MREVELSRGLVALVDDADYDTVLAAGKWYADRSAQTFYARRNYKQDGRWRSMRMHRLITGWPYVDHRNGNGLDNRRANLRPATDAQNARNRGPRSDNTSGYKGVSWHKASSQWCASICVDGQCHHLGLFADPVAAARTYDEAAIRLFGEFARLNFPLQETA